MTLSIPTGTPRLLRDLVHEHTGVHFEDSRLDALVDKLQPRALEHGLGSLLDYYYLLKYDAVASAEWPRVLDALAVPETYFWREIDQLEAVVELLVPECAGAAQPGPVRIWCAAAATGEEPLSLAMLLDQQGLLRSGNVEIVASDGSAQLIERARRGLYRDRSVRLLPPRIQDRYLGRDSELWRVDPTLSAQVTWTTANLRDPTAVARLADAHIVICRNVFIYFSDEAIGDTVQRFADHLRAPAYLCLGASESLLRFKSRFELVEAGGAFVYRRRPPARPVEQPRTEAREAATWTG